MSKDNKVIDRNKLYAFCRSTGATRYTNDYIPRLRIATGIMESVNTQLLRKHKTSVKDV